MRLLFPLLLSAAAAFCQPFSFGLRGGVPMTDFLNAAKSQNFSFTTSTNRYIVGPTAELRLPFGLGVEVDALYRRFSYNGTGGGITTTLTTTNTTGNAWEFPLLVKYRFPMKIVRPYVDAGVAWDTLNGLTQAVTSTVGAVAKSSSSTSSPAELSNTTSRGFVMGVGLDIKALVLHISPEVRFTRWGAKHFVDPNGLLHSNLNQAEFLVGITF